MTTSTSRTTLFLKAGMILLPLLAFFLGWGGGASRSLGILLSGSAPETAVWANSWDDLRVVTARSVSVLLACAAGFIVYSAHQKQTVRETTREIGISLFSKNSIKMFALAFSGWYVFHFTGSLVGKSLENYIPRYEVSTGAVPAENALPFFLATIQAGPTEEIALVPLILLLIPAAFPPRYKKLGLGLAIALAIVARMSFHLYYGPIAFVQHSIWAAGIIATWLITKNVLGLVLAHSCSNGLISLTIDPSYAWLGAVHICLFFAALLFLVLNIKFLEAQVKRLRTRHHEPAVTSRG